MLEDADVERILVVTAHPDDVDFGSSGSIANWTDQGISVSYCILTDGQAGGFDPDEPRSNIPVIRRAEQTAAAACVGVTDLHFLGYMDGELSVNQSVRRDISRVIRQVRPQRMLIQSPERNWDRIAASHPDHLAAGEAAIQAIYPDARNPFAHPTLLDDEGLEPWAVTEAWIMGGAEPNRFVDITANFDRKLAALKAHESQTAHMTELETMLRTWGAERAAAGGLPEGAIAETFRAVAT